MNLNDLHTFATVAELGTFSAAAAELGVPTSTVSRRVARLEEELGLALLTRSSRSFVLSDDGRALHERCFPSLRELAQVEKNLGDSSATPRGALRVTASIDFGTTSYIAGLLADYGSRYPEVSVSLEITNRMVDLLEEGFDVGFRTHPAKLPSRDDLIARRLGSLAIGIYASPAYLEQYGEPQSTEALGPHRIVNHATAPLLGLPAQSHLTANDYRPVAAMLAAGAGIGVLPGFVATPYLRAGQLQRVLPALELDRAILSLVWLRSRHLAPRLRAFIDLAVQHSQELALEAG